MPRSGLGIVALLSIACGGQRAATPAGPDAMPAPAPVPAPAPTPGPEPGGPCTTTEYAGTCAYVRLESGPADAEGRVHAVVQYRVVAASPPRAYPGPVYLTTDVDVLYDRLDGLIQHLEPQQEVPCRYWNVTGSCAAPPPVVDAPPYALAMRPMPPFEAMAETWPRRICALPTSGVPSAVLVSSCNCGEPLACRARAGARGGVELDVRKATSVGAVCDECLPAQGRCPILVPLAKNHDVLRVNGRASVRVETGDLGMLTLGDCWDGPSPR